MIIGIIGSGGREHSICESLSRSRKVSKIYCFPGNAGTEIISENINIDLNDFESLKNTIIKKKIDIVIIGPEKPLVDGLSDYLEKNNIKVFGPSKTASKLEGSKIFTKEICERFKIPTAKFGIYSNYDESISFLKKCEYPLVVKADGLAAGKGVYICQDIKSANIAVKEIFKGKFGEAKNVLIEEFLKGEEMSFFIISDGKTFKNFGTAQDHKRVFEGDNGPNTGGMGAYSPSRLENKTLNNKILNKIIKPTINALREMNENFKGFLYAGLMIVNEEPFLIEYNVRMGDPECQTILPRLKTDLFEVIEATVNQNLKSLNLEWHEEKTLCVVLCSKGYPDKFENNIEIKNLDLTKLKKNEFIFHAGTKLQDSKIFSNGGRVLNFVVKSKNFKDCRISALKLINEINWNNGFFRKDIGFKVIN